MVKASRFVYTAGHCELVSLLLYGCYLYPLLFFLVPKLSMYVFLCGAPKGWGNWSLTPLFLPSNGNSSSLAKSLLALSGVGWRMVRCRRMKLSSLFLCWSFSGFLFHCVAEVARVDSRAPCFCSFVDLCGRMEAGVACTATLVTALSWLGFRIYF